MITRLPKKKMFHQISDEVVVRLPGIFFGRRIQNIYRESLTFSTKMAILLNSDQSRVHLQRTLFKLIILVMKPLG